MQTGIQLFVHGDLELEGIRLPSAPESSPEEGGATHFSEAERKASLPGQSRWKQ